MPNIDWDRMMGFIGYGPTGAADILFLGLEEKALEGALNLEARSSFASIEDLYEAHTQKLGPAGCYNPFQESGNPVLQWNIAARIALKLEGRIEWYDPQAWSAYWRRRLGRKDGNTFLMECFPFPRKNRASRLPAGPGWTSDSLWQERRKVLHGYLDLCPPKVVVAYGKPTKEKAADLFSLSPDAWRSVPHLKHPASVASNGRTRVAHVGFFGQGQFSVADIPGIVQALLQA